MTFLDDANLLQRLRTNDHVVALLQDTEFDLTGTVPLEPVRLRSGAHMEAIACDGTGGSFFLCGDGPTRPVVYVSSEGQSGLIATDLTSALELVVGLPSWQDYLKFSAGGNLDDMLAAIDVIEGELVEDYPEVRAVQAQAVEALGLSGVPVVDLVTRLHAAVTRTDPDHVVLAPDGSAYDPLYNTFRVADNPAWG